MIGSMGLASSIALGVALKNPTKKVFVFDGDGNILMNLGSLVTIGTLNPKNLIHIIFDNEIHESTGGQPTNSKYVRIDSLAKSANYNVFKIKSKSNLEKLLKNIKKISGPILILIKVDSSDHVSKRITFSPIQIKNRFMNSF
jgi:phosphonopyruvate decarboxylase/sulfopyruvate decarboxylase subunit beta